MASRQFNNIDNAEVLYLLPLSISMLIYQTKIMPILTMLQCLLQTMLMFSKIYTGYLKIQFSKRKHPLFSFLSTIAQFSWARLCNTKFFKAVTQFEILLLQGRLLFLIVTVENSYFLFMFEWITYCVVQCWLHRWLELPGW
jgi:hypothetical protein